MIGGYLHFKKPPYGPSLASKQKQRPGEKYLPSSNMGTKQCYSKAEKIWRPFSNRANIGFALSNLPCRICAMGSHVDYDTTGKTPNMYPHVGLCTSMFKRKFWTKFDGHHNMWVEKVHGEKRICMVVRGPREQNQTWNATNCSLVRRACTLCILKE